MTGYELTHFKKMVRLWKTKSLFFCLRYDPQIVFRRQNHITFIFINTTSHDLLVQMAYCSSTIADRSHIQGKQYSPSPEWSCRLLCWTSLENGIFPAVERRNLLRWLSNSACCLYVCIDVPGILWPQVKLIGSMLCQRVHDANVLEGYCSFLSVRSCMPSDFTDSSIPPVLSFDNVFFNVLFHGKNLVRMCGI